MKTTTPRKKSAARTNLMATPRTKPTLLSKAIPCTKPTPPLKATPHTKVVPDTVHSMQLRSGRNKPTVENDVFRQQDNGAYALPAIAVQGPYRHDLDSFRYIDDVHGSSINDLRPPFKLKPRGPDQVSEEIFGGSLSSLSDFEEEESSGESMYFSFDEESSGPATRSLSKGPSNRNFGRPKRHHSRTPVTPVNSVAGSRTVHDAPKKRRKHPYNKRNSSQDDTPSKAVPSRPLERRNAAFNILREDQILTDSNASSSSSFNRMLSPPPMPTGLSSMDPRMIFSREYRALWEETKCIHATHAPYPDL